MLELRRIIKDYKTGDSYVRALDGVSLQFRESEFVSILGPSGCGKTTLLNIIGGLDQYTKGDLIINGVSTKRYNDADWDTYRNHSIGFVFQNYNLIPHQTVLSNVELALTLSGISRRERRTRAIKALREVGLGNQLHKKPNQMSGGQMQRVAIARALVNDPDILLADEPTGALDTQTSVQIMEILRKISRSKLIIMVTHNPELAETYSSRIIKVVDGRVVSDSDPYTRSLSTYYAEQKAYKRKRRNPFAINEYDVERLHIHGSGVAPRSGKGKKSMSFFTALSLSLNNLMTKKGRTFMTAFAGSIGIIGIALILSVSTGVNAYINSVQRETLAGYPLELHAETADLGSVITSLMESQESGEHDHGLDKIYESIVLAQLVNAMGSMETNTNDLASFKKHLESNEAFDKYLSAVQYAYDFNWSIFVREGNEILDDNTAPVVKSDVMGWLSGMSGAGGMGAGSSMGGGMGSMMMGAGFDVWTEMLAPYGNDKDDLVNNVIKEQYEFVDEGSRWPTAANEVVLVVDKNNEISDLSLFALGLRTEDEMNKGLMAAINGTTVDLSERKSWTFDEIRKMEFRLILASECYERQADGTYLDLSTTEEGREQLYTDDEIGFTLKVVGIIRPKDGATATTLTSGSIGYTSVLAKEALQRTLTCELIKLQKENKETDVISGLPFKTNEEITTEKKKAAILDHIAPLDEKEAKAFLLTVLAPTPTEEQVAAIAAQFAQMPDAMLKPIIEQALLQSPVEGMTADVILASPEMKGMFITAIAGAQAQEMLIQQMYGAMTPAEMAETLTEEQIATLYESDAIPHDFSNSNYSKNLALLGDVKAESPTTIYLYASTFENKDSIGALIKEYNDSVDENKQIEYTDYVALLMSSITTVLNAITYVLIAFVAISLVVSSIMIGIITYISVLERTKEIGILRAIGASKKDISRVFNAETLTVGFVAGMIGILVTLALNILINIILFELTGIPNLKAVLPVEGAVILVLISMALTFIAGLFPAGFAAKRNPVEALRSE